MESNYALNVAEMFELEHTIKAYRIRQYDEWHRVQMLSYISVSPYMSDHNVKPDNLIDLSQMRKSLFKEEESDDDFNENPDEVREHMKHIADEYLKIHKQD